MKTNNFISLSVLVIMLLCSAKVSLAQFVAIKNDSSAIAAETSKTIKDTAANVATRIEETAQKYKNKVDGWLESGKQWSGSFMETINATKENIADAQSSVNSAIEGGKSLYDDATTVPDEVSSLTSSSGLDEATILLTYNNVKGNMDKRKTAVTEETSSKKTAAENNVNSLQDMYAAANDEQIRQQIQEQLQAAQAELSQYQEALQQLESDPDSYLQNDEEYANLASQLQQLEGQMSDIKSDLTGLSSGYLSDLLSMSDGTRKSQYDQVLGDNFLAKDEEETPDNVWRIMNHRKKVFYNDIVYAFTTAAERQIDMEQQIKDIDRIQSNVSAVDYKQSSANMLIEQRIHDIDVLYNYTQLIIAELRLRTARNMAYLPVRRWNYDKDPSVLNLDDYIFTEKDIGTDADKENPLNAALGF